MLSERGRYEKATYCMISTTVDLWIRQGLGAGVLSSDSNSFLHLRIGIVLWEPRTAWHFFWVIPACTQTLLSIEMTPVVHFLFYWKWSECFTGNCSALRRCEDMFKFLMETYKWKLEVEIQLKCPPLYVLFIFKYFLHIICQKHCNCWKLSSSKNVA